MKTTLLLLSFLYCLAAQGQDTLVVHFGYNQSALSPEDSARIDSVRASLFRVALYGYCDSIGGDAYNDSLSLERVRAVQRLLLSKPFSDTLVSEVRGFGKRKPLNANRTEIERGLNRRVEMVWYPLSPVVAPALAPSAPAPPSSMPRRPRRLPTALIELSPSAHLAALFQTPAQMVGKRIVLRNVNFFGGHHYPQPSSYKALAELLQVMISRPGLRIEIQGFVCCLPDGYDALDQDTDTINLSTARARFIYVYLKNNGIDSTRMTYVGFGSSQKLCPGETTRQEREKNRRVQIKVTAWKEP